MLTCAEIAKLVKALGDGYSPPKHTNSVKVNHMVDLIIGNEIKTWDQLSTLEKRLYAEEISYHRTAIGPYPESGVCE